jgi:hypothetical protein
MQHEITVDGVQYASAPEQNRHGCTGCSFDSAGECRLPISTESGCSRRSIIWIKKEQKEQSVVESIKFRDVLLDAIKAGKEIETVSQYGGWKSIGQDEYFMICTNQYSDKGFRDYYRIKPEVPEDRVTYMFVEAEPCLDNAHNKSNLKLTFDGTTGELTQYWSTSLTHIAHRYSLNTDAIDFAVEYRKGML